MIADQEWALLVALLDALATHFADIRTIHRDRELHAAYVAYVRFIEARDTENE